MSQVNICLHIHVATVECYYPGAHRAHCIPLFLCLQNPTLPQHIQDLFDAMDASQDGTLDGAEIDKVIEKLQVKESLVTIACFVYVHVFICIHNV